MKTKFWQTNAFKELEKEWYSKLKTEKFNDIETKSRHTGDLVLKEWTCRLGNSHRGAPLLIRESKERYYELLNHNFESEKYFKDEIERFVMHRRGDGIAIKTIALELKSQGARCSNRWTIRQIIRKYELKWAIKKR